MHKAMVQTRQEADLAQADAQKKWEQLQGEYQEALRTIKDLRGKIEPENGGRLKVADGTICGVSHRLNLAWIDLGWADSLRRMLPFTVYPPEAVWLQQSAQKGTIEVTRILEDHLAEARVMDEQIADPILRGDKVHSPFWSPRSQQ